MLNHQGSDGLLRHRSNCAHQAAALRGGTSGNRGMQGPSGSWAGQLQDVLPVLYMTCITVSQLVGTVETSELQVLDDTGRQ